MVKQQLGKLLFAVLAATLPASEAAADTAAVRHRIHLNLLPAEQRIEATDELALRGLSGQTLSMRLSAGARILAIESAGRSVSHTFERGLLRIDPPANPAETGGSLTIRYTAAFDDAVPELPANTDNPGYGVTGIVSSRGTMLLAGAGWYPRMAASEQSFHLTVTAPAGILAVTAGRSLGHETRGGVTTSRWQVDRSVEGIPLVAGPYQVSQKAFGSVMAATYFTAANQDLAPAYLDAVGRYLKRYEALFGPYPFAKFAVVENFFPTGYGFPSFTLLGGRVLRLPFIIRTSLGHEIAHCWWGNGVLVDYEGGNWSEGLTSYVSDYLAREEVSAAAGSDHRRQLLRNYTALADPGRDFPLSRFRSRYDPPSKAVGYDKAAMVFHMLRRRVGDANFWQGLRDFYAAYRFKQAGWQDIRKTFEAVHGRSLQGFFEQWIERPGAPRLSLQSVQSVRTGSGWRITGTLRQPDPAYHLEIPLRLDTASGPQTAVIEVESGDEAFTLTSRSSPRLLTVDPQFDVLRRLHPLEIPPTVNDLRGAAGVFVVLTQAFGDRPRPTAALLARSLGLRDERLVTERELAGLRPGDRDLLFIGRPADDRYLQEAPARFKLAPQGVVLNGRTLDDPRTGFFGIFRHPTNEGRRVAVFLPPDGPEALAVARKIAHYGRYSYLVFNGERNQAKGTWPPAAAPLVYRWPSAVAPGNPQGSASP